MQDVMQGLGAGAEIEGRVRGRVFPVGAERGKMFGEGWLGKLAKASIEGKGWKKFGANVAMVAPGAAVSMAMMYGAYRLISGNDDNHNTIEGLPEKGAASDMRKVLTDFGSGYSGANTPVIPRVVDKQQWHNKHLESMKRASSNAYKSGQRHRYQTGKVVI